MLELNPMVPLGCQLSLNIAVESYVDDLRIGLSADAAWLPDLDVAKRGIEQSLRELLGNIRGESDPTAATKPARAGADGTSKRERQRSDVSKEDDEASCEPESVTSLETMEKYKYESGPVRVLDGRF